MYSCSTTAVNLVLNLVQSTEAATAVQLYCVIPGKYIKPLKILQEVRAREIFFKNNSVEGLRYSGTCKYLESRKTLQV